MTVFFGDTEYLDRIDRNPAAIPDVRQVLRRFDEEVDELIPRLRRRDRHRARHWARIARRAVSIATHTDDGVASRWVAEANETLEADFDYVGLETDPVARRFIRLLVGSVLVWLVSEGSLS